VPQVAAVVPVFFPDPATIGRMTALLGQVDILYVVDDGTTGDALQVLDGLVQDRVTVLRHDSNRGIAAALNTGTEAALAAGADFVLTVDQDTDLPAGYVVTCLGVFEQARVGGVKIGVVAAGSINGAPVLPHEFIAGVGLMRYAIQSGLLISAECFLDCGLFDDRLVIDAVDTEFCLRVWDHGYGIAAGLGTDIVHELGTEMPAKTLFGRQRARDGVPRTYEYHAPFRQYYISRNGLDLFLRNLRSNRRWAVGAIKIDAYHFAIGFTAGPHRTKHAVAGALGLVHGLVRHRGKLSPWWSRRLTVAKVTPPRAPGDGMVAS
jgi:rhamnosyltransferase